MASTTLNRSALVGIGFRIPIARWTMRYLDHFDILEITVDHYIRGGEQARRLVRNLVGRVPLILHGVGLSIGTDVPVDEDYLDNVLSAINDLQPISYSEHLAWTKVPEIDIANLLPVPKTHAAAEMLIPKIKRIQELLPIPFALENISYVFDFPNSEFGDAEFFNLLFRETGVGMLLDVENLFVNSENHGVDAYAFLDALPRDVVKGIHAAGGPQVDRPYLDGPVWADNHSHAIPEQALELLEYALARQNPESVILERDTELERGEEILSDVARIRQCIQRRQANA